MKEHFEHYNEIKQKIKELFFNLEAVNSQLYGLKAVSYEEKPKGNPLNDATLYLIDKKDRLEKQIDDLKEKEQELFDLHNQEINKVVNDKKRSILRCLYLYGNSISETAKMLDISVSYLFTLKKEAEEEFKEIIVNSSK